MRFFLAVSGLAGAFLALSGILALAFFARFLQEVVATLLLGFGLVTMTLFFGFEAVLRMLTKHNGRPADTAMEPTAPKPGWTHVGTP